MPDENVQQETAQDDKREARRSNGIGKRILTTAMGLFETQGVGHTYVSDIMRGESLTRELFYYYYTDKNELVRNVIDAYRETSFEAIREAVELAGELPEPRLQAAAQAIMELCFTEDCKHTAMTRVFGELGIFRKMMGEMTRFGAECVYGPDDDAEHLRKISVLLLACEGMAAVCDGDRELVLGQTQRMIAHVLAMQ